MIKKEAYIFHFEFRINMELFFSKNDLKSGIQCQDDRHSNILLAFTISGKKQAIATKRKGSCFSSGDI